MKILTNKYFWFSVTGVIIISGIILWLRKYKCEEGKYPWDSSAVPLIYRGKCSFWTGKPIEKVIPPVDNSADMTPGTSTESFQMTVSASGGANVYIIENNQFTKTGSKVPYGTQLAGKMRITPSGVWYQTSKGWLSANDINIPH